MARKSRGKDKGTGGVKVGIKDPQILEPTVKKEPPGKPPKNIRMLMSLAGKGKSYPEGSVYRVPQDISVKTARSWIDSGAAEEVE